MARWAVRLAAEAEGDLVSITRWTSERFGRAQAKAYRDLILESVRLLGNGPEPPQSKARDDITPGLRTIHVTRRGRRGRHFVCYRTMQDHNIILVVRILHDGMDLARHLPPQSEGP